MIWLYPERAPLPLLGKNSIQLSDLLDDTQLGKEYNDQHDGDEDHHGELPESCCLESFGTALLDLSYGIVKSPGKGDEHAEQETA